MAVVTISRQFGAGGRTLGLRLCERFKFHLVDASVIDELAHKAKISVDWLAAMEKEASSTTLRLISSVVSSGIFYRTPAVPGEEFERKKYIDFLSRIMTSMAEEGGYVLIGRGSQLVLKNHPKVLHILLVGEAKDRVQFLIRHYHMSQAEAEEMIREKEKQRAAVATNIFGMNIDDPSLYHMILNTSRIPFDRAVNLAADLLVLFMKEIGERVPPNDFPTGNQS
jgi:cytidylate kinase